MINKNQEQNKKRSVYATKKNLAYVKTEHIAAQPCIFFSVPAARHAGRVNAGPTARRSNMLVKDRVGVTAVAKGGLGFVLRIQRNSVLIIYFSCCLFACMFSST